MKRNTILIFAFLFICGCTTVKYEYNLPSQDINAPVPAGKTRVVFYNTTNLALFPGRTWRVGIKIDGVGVYNLHIRRYVQVYLEPGLHELNLSHTDVFTFRDRYEFEVGSKSLYVKVFNGLVSTKYEVVDSLPEGFLKKYKPVQ